MNVEIKNFGPIEYLKIDLEKDLHLIYGKNAIGKSYAIYCLYCLLKSFKNKNSFSFSSANSDDNLHLNSLYEKFQAESNKNKNTFTDATEIFFEILNDHFKEDVLKEFQNSIGNTFSSIKNLKNKYSNKRLEIIVNLPQSKVCKALKIFSKGDGFDIRLEPRCKKIEFRQRIKQKNKITALRIDDENFFERDILVIGSLDKESLNPYSNFLSLVFEHAKKLHNELNAGIKDIYFLPASRSGLYQALNTIAPIIAELTQNRMFIKNRKIELPALSEPVSDYFLDLSTVDRKTANKEFQPLVKTLEEKILKGKIDFNEETKNITYEPNGLNIALNLSEASSMVAELSPLVLYLRHIIHHKFKFAESRFGSLRPPSENGRSTDILFIEEPEAHLHPEVQVALMKVFVELAKQNLKVFITSHSNYMFHELNNIILDKKIDTDKIAVYHLVQTKKGSTQNKDMMVSEEGIDDENFQETSERLYEERMRILDENEETENA